MHLPHDCPYLTFPMISALVICYFNGEAYPNSKKHTVNPVGEMIKLTVECSWWTMFSTVWNQEGNRTLQDYQNLYARIMFLIQLGALFAFGFF